MKKDRIEFETYRNVLDSYTVNNMKQDNPSSINFLSYKKYKVTITEVSESTETYIDRLEKMLQTETNHHRRFQIKNELEQLRSKL